MKKTFKFSGVVIMLVAAMMAMACSSEQTNANKLVGTWKCTGNNVAEPGADWGAEEPGSLNGSSVTFLRDGTFKASVVKLVDDVAVGYWSITDTSNRLYINGDNYWKIKIFSESTLRLETYFVDGTTLTYDTAGATTCCGPFTREFMRQ